MKNKENKLIILHHDDLTLCGFAGHNKLRLVMGPKVFGGQNEAGAWPGIGNFVYLADARFNPHGETRLHPHREVDVISVMVEGRIAHEGSLEHGQEIIAGQVQVQRAGGEGFSHNEINPDDVKNRMIQVWVSPEVPGQPASYKLYSPEPGNLMRIYGGPDGQDETYASKTLIDVGILAKGNDVRIDGPYMVYVTKGAGLANGEQVKDGDLVRGEDLVFAAGEDTQLIAVHLR